MEAKAMKKTPLQIFAAAAVLSFVGAVGVLASVSSDEASTKKLLDEIVDYKSWGRVTEKPMPVEIASAAG